MRGHAEGLEKGRAEELAKWAECLERLRSRMSRDLNFNEDYVRKALACCALLPPPGDAEVRKFAEDWLEMRDEIRELEDAAYQRGLAEGREQGRAQGSAEERALVVAAIRRYQTVRLDVCGDGRCQVWLVSLRGAESPTMESVEAAIVKIMEVRDE